MYSDLDILGGDESKQIITALAWRPDGQVR
jgi:hypothetical protein